jgi:hypothetical protein
VRLAIRKLDTLKVLLMLLWETKSLRDKKYIALSLPLDGRDTFLSSSAVTERFVEYLKQASRLIRP